MGDRVAVLDRGVLQQCATPRELFAAPVNLFVAGFIGSPAMNLFPARLDESGVSYDGVVVPITPAQRSNATSDDVTVGVRPDGWDIARADDDGAAIAATVEVVEELGTEAFVYCRSDDGTRDRHPRRGDDHDREGRADQSSASSRGGASVRLGDWSLVWLS